MKYQTCQPNMINPTPSPARPQVGKCARACKTCEPCSGPSDKECYGRNRQKQGLLVYDPAELDTPLNWLEADQAAAATAARTSTKAAAGKAGSSKGGGKVHSREPLVKRDKDLDDVSDGTKKGIVYGGTAEDDGDTSY